MNPAHAVRRRGAAAPPIGPHRQDSQHVIDAAIGWLDGAPARGFYLWVHLIDLHMPYRHGDAAIVENLTSATIRTSLPLGPDGIRAVRAAYATEGAHVDRQLLRLLDALEARGILDTGIVVFTSDHGEEFWEHDGIEHGPPHPGEGGDGPP